MLGRPAAALRWVIYLSLVMTTTMKATTTTTNVSYVSILGLKDGPSGGMAVARGGFIVVANAKSNPCY